jgi:hypothetical protein
MATVTHEGWSISEDEIPQASSILLGPNLRSGASPKPLSHVEAQSKAVAESIEKFVRENTDLK